MTIGEKPGAEKAPGFVRCNRRLGIENPNVFTLTTDFECGILIKDSFRILEVLPLFRENELVKICFFRENKKHPQEAFCGSSAAESVTGTGE